MTIRDWDETDRVQFGLGRAMLQVTQLNAPRIFAGIGCSTDEFT